MLWLAVAASAGYIIGSLPTGLAIARARTGIDIRAHGSGATGGTNVARLLGWPTGVAVVAADAAKGFLAVQFVARAGIGSPDDGTLPLVAGLCAVVGHLWPVFAGFRGGKGVATSAGVLLAVQPWAVLGCVTVFAVVLGARRIVSLASLAAVLALPVVLGILNRTVPGSVSRAQLLYALGSGGLIAWAHRSNVARLRAGHEPELGAPHEPRPPH